MNLTHTKLHIISVMEVSKEKGLRWEVTMKRTEVLHDMLMLEVLQQLHLAFQRVQHLLFTLLVDRRGRRQIDLFHGHEKTGRSVHTKVNLPERARTDQRAFNPPEA